MMASCDSSLLVEHLAGRRLPADMNGLPDVGREAAVAIGDLHHQPVVGRQADMDVDQGAEIRHEFHRTAEAVVDACLPLRPDLTPLRPQRTPRPPRLPPPTPTPT